MPLKWIEPEEVIDYKGVSVYHTYRHDSIEDPYDFYYTTDITEQSPDFDIRNLTSYSADISHEEVLKSAIKNGEITVHKD